MLPPPHRTLRLPYQFPPKPSLWQALKPLVAWMLIVGIGMMFLLWAINPDGWQFRNL